MRRHGHIRHGDLWIVLADGSGARLYRRRAAMPGAAMPAAAMPGAIEPLPCRCGEDGCGGDSVPGVAGILNEAAALGLFGSLMLVAPPPALHALKRALLPAAGALVVREETRNLLALPDAARAAKLAALLRDR